MDLEKYKILLTVIDSGSLSAAADIIGYTPSGISRMMASLETELGFSLLHRSKNGIMPTKECELLLPAIREFVFSGKRILQIAAQINGIQTGTIIIATAYSHYYKWLVEMTSQFHNLHQGVQFRIINGTSSELIDMLYNHSLDFCLISKRSGNHNWIPLCKDAIVAMLPKNHPLTKLSAVPIETFAIESYIETYPQKDIDNSRVFADNKIHPNTQFSTMDIYATYSMVEAGLGISMNNKINSQLWNGTVQHLPLEPAQTIEIGIAYPKDISPVAKAFLNYINKKLP